jgi:peptidoglycan/LPS O-acetylase OafA/YrhL
MRSSSGDHWVALDHIRLLAAFMVFTWHFVHGGWALYPIPPEIVPRFIPFSLLDEGHTGVALFMALSGYLFAKLLDGKTVRYGAFFYNRALRLAPLLVVVMLITAVIKITQQEPLKPYLWSLLTGFVMPTWPNGGWSITAELHFYLLLPGLLWLLKRSAKLGIALLLAMLAVRALLHLWLGEVQSLAYWTIIGRLDQFVVGMLAFRYRHLIAGRHWLMLLVACAFCIFYWLFNAAGGWLQMPSYPSPHRVWIFLPLVEAVAYACLVAWYDSSWQPSASGVSGFLARLGSYAYSIYLLHAFFVFKASTFIHEKIIDISNFNLAVLASLVCFVLMMPLGYLSYRFIEAPFLRLRKKYTTPANPADVAAHSGNITPPTALHQAGNPPATGASAAVLPGVDLPAATLPAVALQSASTDPTGRWTALDGLRGLMSIGVFMAHIKYEWVPGAIIFMDMFFLLSSFFITRLLLKAWTKTGKINYKAFYIRRVKRLFPALLLVVISVVLFSHFYAGLPFSRMLHVVAALFYFANWLRALGIPHEHVLGHTWSLSIEEQFYLVWPLMLATVLWCSAVRTADGMRTRLYQQRYFIVLLCSIVLVTFGWRAYLALAGASIHRTYNGTDMRLDSLALGALLALCYDSAWVQKACARLAKPQLMWPLLLAVVYGCFVVDFRHQAWYVWQQPLYVLISLALIMAFLHMPSTGLMNALFQNPVMRYLGTICYGIYLWHFPLIILSREALGLGLWSSFAVCAPLTLLLASLSYHWVELPMLQHNRGSAK